MKKLLKWIVGLFAGLLALLLIAVLAVFIIFDSDELKSQLASQVKQKTSADLTIEQDLSLSVFPWIAIETGGLILSQPEGFANKTNAMSIEQLSASVKLMPLFKGEIEIGAVELTGAQLNLIRDRKGRSNIDVMATTAQKESQTEQATSEVEVTTTDSTGSFKIQKVTLSDFTLNQYDPRQKLTQSFSLESFAIDNFELDKFLPIKARGHFKSGSDKTSAKWQLVTDLKVSKGFQSFALKNLDASLTDISTKLDELHLTGETNINQTGKDSKVTHNGQVTVDGQSFDVELEGVFSRFKDIKVKLSTGSLQLDKWLVASGSEDADVNSSPADFSPIASFLKTARINGQLDVDNLSVKNMEFKNVSAQLSNKGSTLWLKPFKAQAFQGQLSTIASINFAAKPLALSVQPTMKDIQVGDLISNLFEVERLSGLGAINMDMRTKGLDAKQMLQNLSGKGSINLSDGALLGLDFNKLIKSGLSLELLNNNQSYAGKTVFAALKGNVNANQGLINLNNFAIQSPLFDLVGKASTNAHNESLTGNFKLQLKGALKTALEQKYPQLAGVDLPFELKGTWNDPKPSIDIESLLKAKYGQQIDDKINEEKEKIEDKIKDKLKDKLFRNF